MITAEQKKCEPCEKPRYIQAEIEDDRGLILIEDTAIHRPVRGWRRRPDRDCGPERAGVPYQELRRLTQETHRFRANRGIRKPDVVAVAIKNDPNTAILFLALACHCRMAPVVSICCIALLRLELCSSTGRSRPVAHRQLPES